MMDRMKIIMKATKGCDQLLTATPYLPIDSELPDP